jgi:excinuclease ABC subunit A
LDEPTTGLSFEDCAALLRVLHRLVDNGNTVLLIEHNLDLIKNADWVIDLGPGAGDQGGQLIATGTPEDLARVADSYTGQFLRKVLGAGHDRAAEPAAAAGS